MIFHPQRSLADGTDRWSAKSGRAASGSHAELMKGDRHSVSVRTGASAPGSPSWPVEAGTFVAVAALAWYFVYLRYIFNSEFPLATSQALAEGSAYIPFQFRALVPWIAGAVRSAGIADLATAYKWLEWASLAGVFYAFRYLLTPLMARGTAGLLSFSVFFILPWNYILPRGIPILLPYDLPAVMFFTLGLALLRRRNWGWYYIVFVLGCMNRETMVFLAVVLIAMDFGGRHHRSLLPHLGLHVAIWGTVKVLMSVLYGDNPGTAFELYHVGTNVLHLKTNFELLIDPQSLLLILSNFGFAWVLAFVLWKRVDDRFTRKAIWVFPPYIVLTFIAGNMNEIRVFGELMPLVLVPALLIVVSFAGAKAAP